MAVGNIFTNENELTDDRVFVIPPSIFLFEWLIVQQARYRCNFTPFTTTPLQNWKYRYLLLLYSTVQSGNKFTFMRLLNVYEFSKRKKMIARLCTVSFMIHRAGRITWYQTCWRITSISLPDSFSCFCNCNLEMSSPIYLSSVFLNIYNIHHEIKYEEKWKWRIGRWQRG